MNRPAILLLSLSFLLLLPPGCRKEPPPRAPQPLTALPDSPPDVVQATAAKQMLPKHAKKKGPVLVGGCKESCEDPKNAFRNFVRALFDVADEGAPPYTMFVDSTTLVDNGETLGRRWADMWVMKRKEERQAEVDAWLEAYRGRVGTVSGRSAVEEALEAGLQFQRISSELVEFTFAAPNRTAATNAGEWRIRMGRRGLEWLVQEIYD